MTRILLTLTLLSAPLTALAIMPPPMIQLCSAHGCESYSSRDMNVNLKRLKRFKPADVVRIDSQWVLEDLRPVVIQCPKLREFVLSVASPTKGLDQLGALKQLKTLKFNFYGGDNIDFVTQLKTVEVLRISHAAKVAALPNLAGLTQLKSFILRGSAIASTRGLEGAKGLTVLHLVSNKKLTDVSDIAGLTQLEDVSLGDNFALKDISALAGLSGLKRLSLKNTRVTDLSPLHKMTTLSRLYVDKRTVGQAQIDAIKKALPKLRFQ